MFLFFRQFFLFFITLFIFIVLYIVSLIGYFLPEKISYFLVSKLWSFLFLSLLLFLRVEVERSGAKISGVFLYYSNHQSFLDILVVGADYPIATLMKEEIAEYPIFGFMVKVVGSIPVGRYRMESREKAKKEVIKKLTEGFSVHFYPEGTRRKDDYPSPIEKVQGSLFDLVYEKGIGVIPLTLKGTNQIRLDWKFKPIKVKIHFGEKIDPKNFLTKEDFFKEAWNTLLKNFNAL